MNSNLKIFKLLHTLQNKNARMRKINVIMLKTLIIIGVPKKQQLIMNLVLYIYINHAYRQTNVRE